MNMQMLFSESKFFARGTIETGMVWFDESNFSEEKIARTSNLYRLHLQQFAILQTYLSEDKYRFEAQIRDINDLAQTPEASRSDLVYSLSGRLTGRNAEVFHFFTKLKDVKPENVKQDAQTVFKGLTKFFPQEYIFEVRIYKVDRKKSQCGSTLSYEFDA